MYVIELNFESNKNVKSNQIVFGIHIKVCKAKETAISSLKLMRYLKVLVSILRAFCFHLKSIQFS